MLPCAAEIPATRDAHAKTQFNSMQFMLVLAPFPMPSTSSLMRSYGFRAVSRGWSTAHRTGFFRLS
jgi:hypothetical protein